jgi:hypothetical protein
MSVAWTTAALVVLLLPGVFFIAGLSSRERFAREIVRASAVGEIAFALFIAIIIHLAAYGILQLVRFDAERFFRPFLENLPPRHMAHFGVKRISRGLVYVLATATAGYGLGYWAAALIAGQGIPQRFSGLSERARRLARWLRRLAAHGWIYEITEAPAVNAYVLTTTSAHDRFIIYKGVLREHYLNPDGTFAYIVLTSVSSYFMHMDQKHPTTGEQRKIFDPVEEAEEGPRYFVISGEHIANVILDTSPGVSVLSDEEIEEILRGIDLSDLGDEPEEPSAGVSPSARDAVVPEGSEALEHPEVPKARSAPPT